MKKWFLTLAISGLAILPVSSFGMSGPTPLQVAREAKSIEKNYYHLRELYQQIINDKTCMEDLESCSKYQEFKQEVVHSLQKLDNLSTILQNAFTSNAGEARLKPQILSSKKLNFLKNYCSKALEEYRKKYNAYISFAKWNPEEAKKIKNQLWSLESKLEKCKTTAQRYHLIVMNYNSPNYDIFSLYTTLLNLEMGIRNLALRLLYKSLMPGQLPPVNVDEPKTDKHKAGPLPPPEEFEGAFSF